MRGADLADADPCAHAVCRWCALRRGLGGGGFGGRLALLARHRLLRIAVRLALLDAGGIEKAHHAIRWLRALRDPGLDLLEVELQPLGIVLRQQRVEVAEPLDEAAI